ncbi:alkaline phosphatase family protein [Mesorhizobium plurifarium]|uniref:alkaline phosphatase family protein n=1 Tax=Sinorhizobium arboris TaxID=76745 RepID=UPI000415F250|nr:alkaline phosphatase family protein [Sinorhizobium arboris]PST20767.1 alkaline phosphatase family protein [Mesorhizobium plurifarium]
MQRKKVFMIMIDGISSDYFASNRKSLPNLSALADRGFLVERLSSPMPAMSMPGRASIVTGDCTEAHGIFGNRILVDGRFEPPQAQDVMTRTIAQRASEAGLDVACVGHALIRPEHTSVYVPPCWLRGSGFLKKSDLSTYLLNVKDPKSRLEGLPLAVEEPGAVTTGAAFRATTFFVGDQLMVSAATALACSDSPPDLILTEVNMTDTYQHDFGYESREAHASMTFADLLVGQVISRLSQAGRLSDYVIAITSDHGHGPIHTAIYANRVFPAHTLASEGAVLHIVVSNEADRAAVTARLAEFGAEPWNSDHVPNAVRDQICTFIAPPGHDFEEAPQGASADQLTGKPKFRSTHGFRPGSPLDDRICIFAGNTVPKVGLNSAEAERFAPTLGRLLGLEDTFAAKSLFE